MKKIKYTTLLLCFSASLWFNLASAQMFGRDPDERQRTYDVQHIKIEVRLDLKKKSVEGRTTTSIVPLYDTLSIFKVDAVGMNIKNVAFLFPQKKSAKFGYDSKEITIKLNRKFSRKDTITYLVEYSTVEPEKGIYFIAPDSVFPNKHYEVWTQGEGEDNRYWFPCYDYPNDKATTETYITLDAKYTVLSNGRLVDIKDNNNGETATWHWVLNNPHSSYLVMLAAGDFEAINDSYSDIGIYTYVPLGRRNAADSAVYLTPDMMKFFSESIGFKYPWDRYAQIVVQDFVYGGMENTTAVVYYDAPLHDSPLYPDYTSRGLIAHELSHQWWGDVVTCSNWKEIWLNESFATYFDALYTEHLLGKDEFDYQILKSGNSAITADSSQARKPIYTIDGLTVNTYDKGAVVLNMLRNQIGTENFWRALNIYITKNKFQPVTTPDLINAVNEAMNENPLLDRKPMDFRWFFDEWVYKAGQPEYKVSYSFDESSNLLTLNAVQVQRLDSSSVFQTPVTVEIITDSPTLGVKEIIEYDVMTNYEMREYPVQLDSKPLCVIFNKGNKVLSKLYFSKPKEDWICQLQTSPDAVDRISALKGLKDSLSSEDVIKALLAAVRTDKFWGVKFEAVSLLGQSASSYAAGNLVKLFDEQSDTRIKRNILLSLAQIKKDCDKCIETTRLHDFILNKINNTTNPYLIADGINVLSRFLPKVQLYDDVSPFINLDSHVEIVRRNVLSALDSAFDDRAKEIFLKYAAAGSTSRLRNIALNNLRLYLNDRSVIDFLNSKLSDKNRGTKFKVLELLELAKDKSSVPYIEALLTKTLDKELIKRARELLSKF